MKRKLFSIIFVLVLAGLWALSAIAESDDDWMEKPIITHICELEKEKLFVEWDGKSNLYQVYLDGKIISTVKLQNAIIELKSGTHQLVIVPVNYISKNVDTSISLGLDAKLVGAEGSIDLGALGVDPKDLIQGNASDTAKINYNVNPIVNSTPEIIAAYTDFSNRVILSFTDKYDSNIYKVSIKNGKDINFVEFNNSSEETEGLIKKENTQVTLVLDQQYLKNKECMIPELDQKYSFSVKLQKWPINFMDGSKEDSVVLESKESKSYDYTPYAAWKNAPVITYASQSSDGQITLRWTHDDNGLGCEYIILEQDLLLGVKKGEKEIGRTSANEFTVNDLMNGKYTYAVVPLFSAEKGFDSEPVTVEVKNSWVSAPALECVAENNTNVRLKWTAVEGVENYHITVSVGDGSLLRFVKLDYKKYEEFDVEASTGDMVFTYTYNQPVDLENGTNLKFEIYGVRHTSDGKEQRSGASTQMITLK